MIESQRGRILDEDKANESGINNPIMSWAAATPRNLEQTLLFCLVIPLFDILYLLSPVLKLQHVKIVQGHSSLVSKNVALVVWPGARMPVLEPS